MNPADDGGIWSVWETAGSYSGNETNKSTWTQVFDDNDVAGLLSINPVALTAGRVTGFYVFDSNGAQDYNNGTAAYADNYLSFSGGTGNYGFFDNTLADRIFVGAITYQVVAVPEPASLALIGTGMLAVGMVRRRRA